LRKEKMGHLNGRLNDLSDAVRSSQGFVFQAREAYGDEYFGERLQQQQEEERNSANFLLRSLLSPSIQTLLIKGEPGSGKTTLAIELLTEFGRGIYISSRVSEDMLAEQNLKLQSLLKDGSVKALSAGERFDPRSTTFAFEDFRLASVEDVLKSIVMNSEGAGGRELLLVLDSWDSIASKLDSTERMKIEQTMLVIAEANNVKIVFVSEDDSIRSADYFVDAVVKLEDDSMEGMRVRRLIWKKIRGARIPHRSSLYTLEGGKFTIIEPTIVRFTGEYDARSFQSIPHGKNSFSAGSRDLDRFFGGSLRHGSTIVMELDNRIGPTWHVPIVMSLELNFIANDGSVFILPSGNRPPWIIKENLALFFPEEVLRRSLRIAQYKGFEVAEKDPCYVFLEKESNERTAERVVSETSEIKCGNKRPCFYFIGMDTVESTFGREILDPMGLKLAHHIRRDGDLSFNRGEAWFRPSQGS
jgi:KaiC/GvpD/RAD55 family RecA-like ATPase